MRWIRFGGGLAVGLAIGLLIGGVIGALLGDVNAEIDFCADDGTLRYIHDEAARKQSCR